MLIIVILSPGSQEDGKLTEKTTKVTHKIESIHAVKPSYPGAGVLNKVSHHWEKNSKAVLAFGKRKCKLVNKR